MRGRVPTTRERPNTRFVLIPVHGMPPTAR